MADTPQTSASPDRALRSERLSGGDVWLITVACTALSTVVAAMASLNMALADIAPAIGASSTQITWLVDGYTLTLAALLLPAGSLGDRFGRRGVLISGLTVFCAASIIAVFTTSPEVIIGTRVLAGAAAALIMPATLSLITSGVPPTRRPFAVSIWAGVAGAGAIIGFFATGLLLEFFTWHAVFIAFAVAAATTAIAAFTITSSRDEHPSPFDFLGSASSALAVAAFVFGLIEGPVRGWSDPLVLVGLVGGVVLAGVFVALQLRGRRRLLNVRLFAQRAFGAGVLTILMQFLGAFAVFFLALQRFQLVMGYSPLQSAIALGPLMVVVLIMSIVGNRLAVRFSFRWVLAPGMLVLGVGLVLLGEYDSDHYWVQAILLSVVAFGIGLSTAPATTGIMVSTPSAHHGVASAVNDTSRELGAAIGMALAGSIVAAGFSARIRGTVESTREQLTGIVRGLTTTGQTDRAATLSAQIDTVSDRIGRSLAEALATSDQLRLRLPAPIADSVADGARAAFLAPMTNAYIALGSIVLVSSVILAFWAPHRLDPSLADLADGAGGGRRS